ncbi:MAG: glycosyltransferase family 2 protein [Roseimicrobium sp.]
MNPADTTPLILTYNEEPNLRRSLERLQWAAEVVVLDSFSSDATEAIARSFANVRYVQRKFDDHTTQWNHGVSLVTTRWVLALDADYVAPTNFASELQELEPGETAAFHVRFRYLIAGKALRATLYPPRAVLFRPHACRYVVDGHTQALVVTGNTAFLQSVFDHDDRKPLSRWFISQDNYAKLEAQKLTDAGRGLRLQDKLRRTMMLAPLATFFYCLIGKQLIFDGWRGWFYTWQRVLAEVMLALRLLEARLGEGQEFVRSRVVDEEP